MSEVVNGEVLADFPEALAFLFEPARFKVAYGGRGAAKTWNFARALLTLGGRRPLRIMCSREIQNSIRESVHQILRDQITELSLDHFYSVHQTEIRGLNGTTFIFSGLKHNIASIKSKEGIDIVWVEEAQTVSKSSWDTLIPTIRKPNSEIWVSLNPELDTDETYRRFILNPPPGAVVRKVNFTDNPWFPDVLRAEKDYLKLTDEDAYLTVWLGHTKAVLDGAIFANEIRRATSENRFTRVPVDAVRPVQTFWDLGRADKTAIWFAQQVGFEFRLVDYYESRGEALGHYLRELRSRPYLYGETWLPHDAENKLLASELTIEQQVRAAGFEARIVPHHWVKDGIEAARVLFSKCWFDAERCADGLNALRRYRYDVDKDTGQWSTNPLHDDASHAGDAFRYFAVAMQEVDERAEREVPASVGWMG